MVVGDGSSSKCTRELGPDSGLFGGRRAMPDRDARTGRSVYGMMELLQAVTRASQARTSVLVRQTWSMREIERPLSVRLLL